MTRWIFSILWAPCAFLMSGCVQVQQPAVQTPESTFTADCVAIYHKLGDSAYVTQQQHAFNPDSGSLLVIAHEPTGRLEYALLQESFSIPDTQAQLSPDLPRSFINQALATTIFYGMCAAGSLLDNQKMNSEDLVKIQGQMYQPFTPDWPRNALSVKLLKNQDTGRFELVQVSESSGIQWLARSYNFRYNSDLKVLLPQTIDVFDISEGIASQKLVVQFQYKYIYLTQTPGEKQQ